MVRYSKLPFRLLVRNYGADVIFTPMMLAHEFVRSPIARDSDFTTHPLEQSPTDPHRPALIAQFAASDPDDFARAAALIAPWVDGIDLNCGCPQSWAIREGIGCALQDAPELVARMVRAARVRVGPGTSLSVKIRIDADGARTARWLAVVQDAGVDFVTVHGRLRSQRSSTPPDYAAVRALRDGVRVPLFANGDAYSLADVRRIADATAADGVMAARGILENPALCAGYETVPEKCLGDFLAWVVRCPIPFPLVLHHVSEMTGRMSGMTKMVKRELMECKDLVDLIDFVDEKFPGARVRRGEGDGLIAF
jgi:tRNA-dihydrouridine synthase 4